MEKKGTVRSFSGLGYLNACEYKRKKSPQSTCKDVFTCGISIMKLLSPLSEIRPWIRYTGIHSQFAVVSTLQDEHLLPLRECGPTTSVNFQSRK